MPNWQSRIQFFAVSPIPLRRWMPVAFQYYVNLFLIIALWHHQNEIEQTRITCYICESLHTNHQSEQRTSTKNTCRCKSTPLCFIQILTVQETRLQRTSNHYNRVQYDLLLAVYKSLKSNNRVLKEQRKQSDLFCITYDHNGSNRSGTNNTPSARVVVAKQATRWHFVPNQTA